MSVPNPPQLLHDSDVLQHACAIAREAAARAIACLGPFPDRRMCQKVLTAFRHTIYPVKRPGRRKKQQITEAHRDWKEGMRGTKLYQKHIPGWEKCSHWRRQGEARRLMDAIRSRERRER
jgi:hypothetical protein